LITKPFAHQTVSIKHNDRTPIVYDCSDPGTGKTYVRIAGFAKRRKKGGGCLLVLAPRSLLRSVWLNDIKKFAPHLVVSVADASNREAAFAAKADVYVTNVDAVKWLATQKKAFFTKFDELVVDESTAYKHHTSQRSKAAAHIAKHFKYRCCMTGTPTGNTITDVWHQAYILDDGKRLGNSFYKFRDAVCTPHQVGRQAQMVQWHDKEGAEEAVFGLLSDIVVRHKFEDCVDIPANHQYPVEYELTPKQMRAYLEMQDTQMLSIITSRLAPAIIAINAAAVATKLLQVASGAVYDGTGKYVVIDTARYEMILDLVEQRKHSLVFFLWKHQRDALIAEAIKRKVKYAVIEGDTSDRDRDEIVQGYQAGVYQTLFAHPKSAAHGLTLTKGTATIWSSPTYDLEIFKQGSKRQHRMGQTQKTETIVLIAKDTIEQKVYDAMLSKDARMTNLLDLFGTLMPVAPKPVISGRKKKEVETV
jgi:SNF2 family DNA or RNA helicase